MIRSGENKTPWDDLKREPGKPSRTHFKELFIHLEQLCQFSNLQQALEDIPHCKIKQFASEARSLDAARMMALGTEKKLALEICLIHIQRAKCLDDIGDMFIKRMTKIHNNGQEALNQFHLEHQSMMDELFSKFYRLLLSYQNAPTDRDWVLAFSEIIGPDPEVLLEKIRIQMSYAGNNYYSFLWPFYKGYRSLLFELLEKIPLISTSQDTSLLEAIRFRSSPRLVRNGKVSFSEWSKIRMIGPH